MRPSRGDAGETGTAQPSRSKTTSFWSGRTFITRTLTRRGTDKGNPEDTSSPKGPLGLTTLYEPTEGQAAIVDIIFVHGLGGGSQSTWSKGNVPSQFWPREWLPKDSAFEDVRIHTFGYPSGLDRESILCIHDFARSLLAAIKDSPAINRADDNARLIFVAHSMGGLVVKKAYTIGHADREFQPIVKRVSSIFFLATPHHGSALAQTLSRLIALLPGGRPFVDDLKPHSATQLSINEDFPRVCADIQLMSFFESRPMLVGVTKSLIVDRASAVLNLPNERRTALDADHRHVAMFASPNDKTYLDVRNALATVVGSHRKENKLRVKMADLEDIAAVSRFLGVSAAPEDDLITLDSARLPGSCEWLAQKDYYLSWRKSIDPRFLWLQGRPGAGKSVLAAQTITSLREDSSDCCFFFFQQGDNTKNTSSACLRSLAWQMAKIHPEVTASIKKLPSEFKDEPLGQKDTNAVWRLVFLSAILKVRLDRSQFWVIDGIDECKNSVDIISFLARIQERWPISILATSRDSANSHRSATHPQLDIRTEVISEEDTMRDISLLIASNAGLLPCPPSSKWSNPADMAARIINSSGGCFLWASLICSELREACTEKEIDQVLDSIPSNMDALYTQILRNMSNARFGKDLANSILTWTTYSYRALSTAELKTPIEMDINDKVDDIERSIAKCCGQFVYVDTHGRVHLIHATAREFLTRTDLESEFIVSQSEGHRRIALVCLKYLIQNDAQKPRRLRPDMEVDSTSSQAQIPPFTSYASTFLFRHLGLVSPDDDEIFTLLSKFFSTNAVLRWVELIGKTGDLRPVYHAGKTVNSLLGRRAQQPPPMKSAHSSHNMLYLLEKWADDLVHIATRFSSRLRQSPQSIHHLIPPFCPRDSAIRQQFTNGFRGINVLGLSDSGWDDCLTTVTYPKGTKPNSVAAGQGFFAVGMMNGSAVLYDDSIFQEVHVLNHGEPIWKMAFTEDGRLLATGGAKRIRIWETKEGRELPGFPISSVCLAMAFGENDTVLWVASRQNQLYEWNIETGEFCREEPVTWATNLDESYQLRVPVLAAISPVTSLLAVTYKGQGIVLWDLAEDRIHDIYEQETGSKRHPSANESQAGAYSEARAIAFGDGVETSRLAATYLDGDLHLYNTENGMPVADIPSANTLMLAGSPDGRTLAGADSQGNLTLFDLEKLRPLCRIQFDTEVIPKGLVFSGDSKRLLEIRSNQCRVWEPTVLIRQDDFDESSDPPSILTGPQEISYERRDVVTITAVVCSSVLPVVFCATDDGAVAVYDIAGEPRSQPLFVQTAECGIYHMALEERPLMLACGDLSGRVTVRGIVKAKGKNGAKAIWAVEDAVAADVRCPGTGVLKEVLVSGPSGRLLVVSTDTCTLWSLAGGQPPGESRCIARLDEPSGPVWATCPTDSGLLLRGGPEGFGVYKWETLELVRTVPCSYAGIIDRVMTLSHARMIASVSRDAPAATSSKAAALGDSMQFWDSSRFLESRDGESPATPDAEISIHSTEIDSVIGSIGSRLTVYTTGKWISSLDLEGGGGSGPAAASSPSIVQHFFVPNDWTSTFDKPVMGLGQGGEVVFARQSELAVIRRGLEVVGTTGASFNPRRPSLQQPQSRSGRSLSARSGGSRGTSSSFRGRSVSPMS